MDNPALTPLRLNGRTVDIQRGSVTDDAGQTSILRPQAAEVLKVLLAKAGRVASKDELMKAVWGGIAVTDDSLVQCIIEIRRALGDEKHEIVRTLPKRGYVLEVEPAHMSWADVGHRLALLRRKPLIGFVAGLAVVIAAAFYLLPTTKSGGERPAIAVLPFENLSEDSKWARFADGMTDDIITDLARFRDIPVIARTSTEVYRGTPHDVRTIGEALNVGYVLEGSLRIDLHRLRVTAQLINAKTGEHVWSERYDRQAGDFFAVQDEITQKIAATLTGWQSPISQAQRAAAQRKSAAQLDAYDYWLLGVAEKHKMTPESQIEARRHFEKGLALDPSFQPMVRDLAFTYSIELAMGVVTDRDVAVAKVDELSARAVELDPQDSLAWYARANSAGWQSDGEMERRHLEHALALGPNNADLLVLSAMIAEHAGTAERGPELADRALRLNPHHPHWWNPMLMRAYFRGGAFAQAYPFAHKMGLGAPLYAAYKAMTAAQLGKTVEAEEAATALLQLDPDWSAEGFFNPQLETLVVESAAKAGLPVCMTSEQVARRQPPSLFADCEAERAGDIEPEQPPTPATLVGSPASATGQ